jgi:hypothetical protein
MVEQRRMQAIFKEGVDSLWQFTCGLATLHLGRFADSTHFEQDHFCRSVTPVMDHRPHPGYRPLAGFNRLEPVRRYHLELSRRHRTYQSPVMSRSLHWSECTGSAND